MEDKEQRLLTELNFMYKKYEELCIAYKKLAKQSAEKNIQEVNDMSHMTFKNEKEIM
jgi:hypothetical protein